MAFVEACPLAVRAVRPAQAARRRSRRLACREARRAAVLRVRCCTQPLAGGAGADAGAGAGGAPAVDPALEASIRAYVATLTPGDDGELPPSPLAYLTLRNAGRTDLIEPIMNAGGYITVSRLLGVPVDGSYATYRPPLKVSELASVFDKPEDSAAIAFGARREERLGIDPAALAPPPNVEPPWERSGRLYSGPEPVPSADEVTAYGRGVVEIRDEPVPEGERMTLDLPMRVGTLALVLASTLGYGRASVGVLDSAVIDALQLVAASLGFAHVLLTVYAGAILAPQLRRRRLLWSLKVLLSGPFGIISLRRLGPL